MKQPSKQEAKDQSSQHQDDVNPDDTELGNAATKIQASFRGHLIRKQMEKKDNTTNSSSKGIEETSEELDVDLSDPELNKAAMKIQATFRGHLVRKDNDSN